MSKNGSSVVSFESTQLDQYVGALFAACGVHNDWQRFRREISTSTPVDGWLIVDRHLERIQEFQGFFRSIGETCLQRHSEALLVPTEGWQENPLLNHARFVQSGLKQAGNGATTIGRRVGQVLGWSSKYDPWRELNDQDKELKDVWVGGREGLEKCYLLLDRDIGGLAFEMRAATHKQAVWPAEVVSTMTGNQRLVADEMNQIGGAVSIESIADLVGWQEPFDDSIRGLTREFNAKLQAAGIAERIGRRNGMFVKRRAAG